MDKIEGAFISSAFSRIKLVGSILGAVMLLLMLISVFYRELFNVIPLAVVLEAVLIVWFYLEKNFSKSKILYGCAWGVAVLFILALLIMESEVGLSLFSFQSLAPLLFSLLLLPIVAFFKKITFLRYVFLAVLLCLIIKDWVC
ncbi:MAG: hypothetical protein MJZ33_10940 [Paludibacteraceae bacterium]|nr:hypothetical protein [Paludibacteraceae bacterium]